jgi:2-polyprenyl-6-methoxyphenol hydroxylase-like FAD-dependent oxidoreductase
LDQVQPPALDSVGLAGISLVRATFEALDCIGLGDRI